MSVAALFVEPDGIYQRLLGSEFCWDEARDARTYDGPWPVVAHPPCGRWCAMARMNERRWGARVGDDGGCFASALASVREWGGVLEHPAKSLAWGAFALTEPDGIGWHRTLDGEWVAEVSQSAWGHAARKRTWLLLVGADPPTGTDWSSPRGTHQVGGGIHSGNVSLPRLKDSETHKTPEPFARYLIELARSVNR